MKRVILASGICLGLIGMAMAHSSREQYAAIGNHSYQAADLIQRDTGSKPKPDTTKYASTVAFLQDTTKKPKPDSVQTASVVAFLQDTTKKPKPDSTQLNAFVALQDR